MSAEKPPAALTAPMMTPKPPQLSDPELARWIRGNWHTKKIVQISLAHISQNGRSTVSTWDKDKLVNKDPDTIIQEIYTEAQEDARNFKGPQRYGCFFLEEGSQNPSRKFFVVKGVDWEEGEGDEMESEPATGKGHLAQMMRHNEALMRLAIGGAREGQGVLRGIVSDLVQQNRSYQEMHYRVMETYGQLQDRNFERDMDREDKKAMRALKEQAGTMLMGLAPTALSMFASKLSANDEKTQQENQIKMMVTQFARSLTAEQMEKLLEPLSQEQKISFMQLYNSIREEYLASPEGQAELRKVQEAQAAEQAAQQAAAEAAAEAAARAEYERVQAAAQAAAGPVETVSLHVPDVANEEPIEGEIIDPATVLSPPEEAEPA